ncbi:MAG: hypothetical protein AAFQ81_15335, partial [Pseudomonadota bacterium]
MSAETPSIAATTETARPRDGRLTPAGLQTRETLLRRRLTFLALCTAMFAVLTWGIVSVFGAGGWVTTELIILTAFVLGAPWTILGIANAAVGMWLLHGRRGDAMEAAAPHL